jgi:uncharacterized protein YraI
VLLKRLKQKDLEWRRARAELNKVRTDWCNSVCAGAVWWCYARYLFRHGKQVNVHVVDGFK